MILFHYCLRFKNKIDKEDYKDDIYRKIEENSVRTNFKSVNIDAFVSSMYVLKVSNPRTRIIIEEKNILVKNENIRVFFIRDIILNRNFDRIYGRSIFHKLKNGEWLKINPLDNSDIEEFKESYIKNQNEVIEKLTPPPKKLIEWLDDFKLELNNEVFETEQWVKYALSKSKLEGMEDNFVNTFRLVLKTIIDNEDKIEKEIIHTMNDIDVFKYEENDIGILYSKVKVKETQILILYDGAYIKNQKEYWEKAIENIQQNDIKFEATRESISRIAFRSYPKWTISDYNTWFSIEKSKEISNLSLTSEQSTFLKDFKFPYYINGQAGSGKSTMLYYLFANTYFSKSMGLIEGDLIFLTENEKLLEDTKKYVFDLLTNNPEFDGLSHEDIENSNQYFHSFKNFLLELLTEEDKPFFKKDKYLNFSIFKELYKKSNLPMHTKEKYSAEESWFVIITYIYGNDIKNKVTSNNYETKIDNKSKTISLEHFTGIEKYVLPFYEKLINQEEYWDKLKIIRYISEHINMEMKKKYSVLICDEAQDFCKVELHFILKLSEYLQYDLSQTSQVPVVFAGDPNQTVNPTGFRQDEMTSMLYKEWEIVNFKELSENVYNPSLNYRSTHPVVSLANFVQYYRMKELGIKQVTPQEAKRPTSSTEIEFNIFLSFNSIYEDVDLKENLIKKLENKIFIVPVDSQEKDNYIKNSSLLSSIKKVELKTAVEAKGAEYSQVVLYGFGEYFLKSFSTLDNNIKDNEKFKIGYFFNKLYVGLTRAQTELIIIDSEESKELFWEKLVDNVKIINYKWKILETLARKIILYDGNSIGNILESTRDDALANAKEDKKQGEYQNNPARLKVASSQFLKLGNRNEANECLALAEEMMGEYKLASNYYLKSEESNENLEKASMCLFKGEHFDDLFKIKSLKTVMQDIRIILYRVMKKEKLVQKDIEILSEYSKELYTLTKNLNWRDKLISELILLSKLEYDIEFQRELVEVLHSIATSIDKNLLKTIAELYYKLENYKKAIEIWRKNDFYENNELYFLAQLKFSREKKDVESIVICLNKLSLLQNSRERENSLSEILEIHSNENSNEYNEEYDLSVYKAFLILKGDEDIEEISKLCESKVILDQLENFYREILEQDYSLKKIVTIFILERWAKITWKISKENKNMDWIEELNQEYFNFSKKYHIKYKKFTFEELEKISNLPEPLKLKPSNHLKKITIRNFRQFNKITLEELGQFNLIVGDNNVGKTSILEALLFTSNKELYFKNLAFAYIERKNIPQIVNDKSLLTYNIPNNFIYDFINRNATSQNLEFELEENRNSWNFKVETPTEDTVRKQLKIDITVNSKDYIAISVDTRPTVIDIPRLLRELNPSDSIKTRLIPFGKGFDKNLVQVYYENIQRYPKIKKDFLQSMRIFIPNIEDITVDTNNSEVDIQINSELSPLHQYGEGAKKLFRILVQITLQKGRKLLIDEIDAGIHYSHFSDFLKTILKVAKENDVQIFATTHNLECIQYFKNILEDELVEYQNLSRIISLQKLSESTIKSYTHTFEEFEYELDNEFEIRGGDL